MVCPATSLYGKKTDPVGSLHTGISLPADHRRNFPVCHSHSHVIQPPCTLHPPPPTPLHSPNNRAHPRCVCTTHSYLSRSKGKVVHNLIELRDDGEWLVDDKKFSGTTLDMVVDKIQTRLKSWRHLVEVDPATRKRVTASWSMVYRPKWTRSDAVRTLAKQAPGTFVIRGSTTPNAHALSVRKPGKASGEDSVWNGPIIQSDQGHYLKVSVCARTRVLRARGGTRGLGRRRPGGSRPLRFPCRPF
jgi:hypothetical protein